MRKILLGIFGGLLAVCANAAQVANLDYVHKLIAQKWDISVPISADNPMQVANMKYLLTAIDVANEILNGEKNHKLWQRRICDTSGRRHHRHNSGSRNVDKERD